MIGLRWPSVKTMLAALGDLVDDVVVRLDGPINLASDTAAHIRRRPGGSAANVAVAAARQGAASRFIGQVGDDPMGDVLVSQLTSIGVDMSSVRRSGSTGTIVVVVDQHGERSMLTDRQTCVDLSEPDTSWLDGVTELHVPFYSLVDAPLSDTAATLIAWAHEREIAVSIDVSSVALIEEVGAAAVRELLGQLAPAVIFANEDEANTLDISFSVGQALTVVKRGAGTAVIYRPGADVEQVAAVPIDTVADSTGAGDAFAAGFLTYESWLHDPVAACSAGHQVAAALLSAR